MGMLKTAAFISLPILGICATVLYLLHKKEDDDLYETLKDVKTSRIKVIEMKIPNSTVGIVIGRGGCNIKEIQQKTETRISFDERDDNEEYRTCYIRGTAECAQMAESMLHEIITTQPIIEVHEIWVPQKAVGRIIGKNGETIRAISRSSKAKVTVDSVSNIKGGQTRITIKGTTEMIAVALSLVQEKVEEDAEVRRNMELCQANRSPRNKPKSSKSSSPMNSPEKQMKKEEVSELLIPTGSNKMMNVFVSAIESPYCFWVQKVYGPRSVELDHLLNDMTEYYTVEENRMLHQIKELEIGQIVASPFSYDNRWYRAEVKAIEVNDCNENETVVDLYYVDYGDSEFRKKSDVCQLRTDFLKLRFQAIECTLANVKPSGDQEWSEKAILLFEELCHVAQWKPLWAKVVSCDQQPRGRREGSPVPSVRLFESRGPEEDIDIGDELVKQGFAVRDESCGSPQRSQSRTSGSSTPFLRSATSPEPSSDADSNT